MAKTNQQIIDAGNVIKNETVPLNNTAERIGTQFVDQQTFVKEEVIDKLVTDFSGGDGKFSGAVETKELHDFFERSFASTSIKDLTLNSVKGSSVNDGIGTIAPDFPTMQAITFANDSTLTFHLTALPITEMHCLDANYNRLGVCSSQGENGLGYYKFTALEGTVWVRFAYPISAEIELVSNDYVRGEKDKKITMATLSKNSNFGFAGKTLQNTDGSFGINAGMFAYFTICKGSTEYIQSGAQAVIHQYDANLNWIGSLGTPPKFTTNINACYLGTALVTGSEIKIEESRSYYLNQFYDDMKYLGIDVLIQKGSITANSNSGSNAYFYSFDKLNASKKIAFKLICDNGVVDKYAVVTDNGADIAGDANYYRFEANKWYYVYPNSFFLQQGSFGAYVNAANSLSNGNFTFVIYPYYENVIEREPISNNFMRGVELYSLCDSLGTDGVWQTKLADLTGATFSNIKNNDPGKPLSIGGTATIGNEKNCGQWRAKNLVANYPDAKLLFIENINDMNYNNGSITDAPFMLSRIDNYADQGLTSLSAANTYWTNNFASIVAGYTPVKGACINIPYYGAGKNLKITGLPSANGNVSIIVNGIAYAIAVTTIDTMQSLLAKILEYQYGLVTDSANSDGVSVDFYYSSGVTVTFNAGSTGMAVSITDTTTAQIFTPRYFIGEANTTDWNNSTKWSSNSPTTYAAMRGLIEYLQSNLPTCELIWIIPTRYGITLSNYLRADGTPDIDAFNAADTTYQSLCIKQKAICDLYNIRYVDLNKKSGITLYNLLSYYNENNVHPKNEGYEKWGEMIFRILVG